MKHSILFVRSMPLERDSRSTKMVAAYRERGHGVIPLIWSRGAKVAGDADGVVYSGQGGYGRRFKGLWARFKWLWFLASWMVCHRRSYEIVHVVDFDTGVVAAPLSRLLHKPVIYDAFDHSAAIVGGGLAGTLLSWLERLTMNLAALKIFPDPIRLEQYGVKQNDSIIIVGNIPDMHRVPNPDFKSQDGGPLRIVYIGTLEAIHRGLEFLPAICEEFGDAIEVVIGGTGELHDFFEREQNKGSNLRYIGHQSYDTALRLMANADCLYGPYLMSAPAHRYASPNKMYEHLALGKPLLTNLGTPPAELVERLDSGFLFDGSFADLRAVIEKIDRPACQRAGARARQAWLSEFANLRSTQLNRFFERFDRVAAPSTRA